MMIHTYTYYRKMVKTHGAKAFLAYWKRVLRQERKERNHESR